MNSQRTVRPQLALEMTMRDVLDNMEELACEFAFDELCGEFEILAVIPATQRSSEQSQISAPHIRAVLSAEITPFPYPLKQAS